MKKKLIAMTALLGLVAGATAYEYSAVPSYKSSNSFISVSDEASFESVSKVKFDTLTIDSDQTFEKLSQ